jgi:hypothetical protein
MTVAESKEDPGKNNLLWAMRLPKPKRMRLSAKDIRSGKAWLKWASRLAGSQTVSLRCEGRYGASAQISPESKYGRCLHIAFWTAVETGQDEWLAAALGRLMAAGGLQAFLARWNWLPGFDTLDRYNATPYEMACGAVNGRDDMGRGWGTRYLRAVAPDLWLGPALLALLPSGTAARVHVDADSGLSEVESVLEPVLPGQADFQTAAGII